MANHQLSTVVRYVRGLFEVRKMSPESDGEVLRRFVADHNEAALSLLLQRHGPMVLGVCRRVLGDEHDAEDAFQATFIVLLRKAASLDGQGSLGPWLYTVARRLALKARQARNGRRAGELQVATMAAAEPDHTSTAAELRPILDEELSRLPAKYQAPLVLCYLEGKTNEQAARELGWRAGSMSYRLARGRDLLRRRLQKRGVVLSTGLLGGLAEPVSAALHTTTVQTLLNVATGNVSAAAGTLTPLTLAEAFMRTSSLATVKTAVLIAAALALFGAVAGVGLHLAAVADGPRSASASPAAPAAGQDPYGDPLPAGASARLGTLRWRHGGTVPFVRFAAQDRHLVTLSSDTFFRTWDVESGKEVSRFRLPTPEKLSDPAKAVRPFFTLSSSGRLLAAINADGTVHVWQTATGKEVHRLPLGHGVFVHGLAFAPDEQTLAVRHKDDIGLYEVATGKSQGRVGPCSPYGGAGEDLLAFSADGKTLASVVRLGAVGGKQTKVVRFWERASGKQVGEVAGPQEFADSDQTLSPDGTMLASASSGGAVYLHETATGKELRRFDGVGPCEVVFTPDSKTLAAKTYSRGTIRLWDVASGAERYQLTTNQDSYNLGAGARTLCFSADARRLAEGTIGGTFRLWNLDTRQELQPFPGHQSAVVAVAGSAAGPVYTTLSSEGTIRQWDTRDGQPLRKITLPAAPESRIAVDPSGRFAAFGGPNLTLRLWDIAEDKELWSTALPDLYPGKSGATGGIVFAADGKSLAVRGYDPSIHVLETATGKKLGQITHEKPADTNRDCGLDRIPGGALGQLFPSRDFTMLAFVEDPHLVTTTPAGEKRGLGRFNRIRLGSIAAGKLTFQFTTPKQGMETLAYAPDNRTIISANTDGTLALWETATGKERLSIAATPTDGGAGHPPGKAFYQQGPILCLAFAPDGRTFAAGCKDGTVRLWNLPDGTELGRLAGHQGPVVSLTFTADGAQLLSGSADTTALVWDTAPLFARKPAGKAEGGTLPLESLATDLGAVEAGPAYRALQQLVHHPEQAVTWLERQLQPAPPIDGRIVRLVNALDSAQFPVRESATQELEKLGFDAEAALQQKLAARPPLEVRQRVERLLTRLETLPLSAEQRRTLRSIEVLEVLSTPAARRLLDRLAAGTPGNRVTEEARTALTRSNGRVAVRP